MKNIIRIAVIGCGNIATSAHIPAYMGSENAEIKYFCDILPERAKAAVKKNGCGKAITNYKEILDDPEIDAVSVCTHNDLHSVISIDFLRHGKDVLCEKPAARILSEALEMQKISFDTGRILAIGVCNRYSNAVNEIKRLIESGALGTVYHVYASFRAYRSIPGIGGDFTNFAASGGGSLIDWGVHYLDLIQYCCGEPVPLTASGEAFCEIGKDIKNYVFKNMWAIDSANFENGVYDVDDSVTGLIRTDGPVISFTGAWAQNVDSSDQYIDFMGDKGGIRLQYGGNFKLWTVENGQLTETEPDIENNNIHHDEVIDFIECARRGVRTRNDIRFAVETSKIIQGIYDSSKNHREIVF